MSYYKGVNYKDLTHTEILDTLRQWRENNERPNMELLYMFEAIMKHLPKMGNEKYVIMEQLIYAALDGHCVDGTGKLTIMMLSEEFPDSLRVMIFKAMCFEAKEQYDEALEILDSVIKMDETNALARKRRVAILKAQGLINEAIKELVDYLKKFMSDMEAWQELSEFYLQVQEYSKAAFCVEELILHQPHNHLMHQRYADIRYTMGGVDNMELAKSYYCQALKLNPDNMRALLGLFLVTNNLLTHYKSSGSSKRKEIFKLSQWAQSEAIKRQKKVQPSAAVPALSNLMLSLAIAD